MKSEENNDRAEVKLYCPLCQEEHDAILYFGSKLAICSKLVDADMPEVTFMSVKDLESQ